LIQDGVDDTRPSRVHAVAPGLAPAGLLRFRPCGRWSGHWAPGSPWISRPIPILLC
jgi:hypothetical protein